ncbi:MAG TPA: hypothetical protein VI911_04095 [Patescibacteria group bacterium]|nr:hypothetical protein [Patescibacteria group bacterium]
MTAPTSEALQGILDAITQGPIRFGTHPDNAFRVVTADGRAWPIESPEPLWIVWQRRTDDDGVEVGVYLAITGDGPCSEANAALFAAAPDLAREVLRLRADLRSEEIRADASLLRSERAEIKRDEALADAERLRQAIHAHVAESNAVHLQVVAERDAAQDMLRRADLIVSGLLIEIGIDPGDLGSIDAWIDDSRPHVLAAVARHESPERGEE